MRMRLGVLALCVVAGLVGLGTAAQTSEAQTPAPRPAGVVDLVQITGVIDPPTASFLLERIAGAEASRAEAIVIQESTPGGLDVSTPDLADAILNSQVPVIVWIAPHGARVASTGAVIAMAANLTYMADGTELGSIEPIDLSNAAPSASGENHDVTFAAGIAQHRGHNAAWIANAVAPTASIDAPDAARSHVTDGVASSLRDLLQVVDGKQVKTGDGLSHTLETWDQASDAPSVVISFQQMNPWARLLHSVTSPEVAFFLVLAGLFGLIFELYNPGIGLAGVVGAAALLLALYALNRLPTGWFGVLVLVGGVLALLVDLQLGSLGAWTAAGLAALVGGGLLMFSGAASALTLSAWAIAAGVVFALLFFISVMTAALRVRLRRPITTEDGIIGTIGEAKTDIAPEGTVVTNGTLWRARTMETGIAAGSKVQVKASEGLVLLVEPLHEDAPEPKP
jgi:membrane-bound serine protease (ClpP class)